MKKEIRNTLPQETIVKKIFVLRDERIMLDFHLAELYGVETRSLKQAVKRNIARFPDDLMFELTEDEILLVVSQNVIPHKKYFGGSFPMAFTETGIAMLSSVLKSRKAIKMNLAIMRTFITLRKIAINYKDILKKMEELEKRYDGKFHDVYQTLKYLINPSSAKKRKRIGYRINIKQRKH